jgi:hypothetical protein
MIRGWPRCRSAGHCPLTTVGSAGGTDLGVRWLAGRGGCMFAGRGRGSGSGASSVVGAGQAGPGAGGLVGITVMQDMGELVVDPGRPECAG